MANHKTFLLVTFVVFVLLFSVLTVLFWAFMSDTILVPVYYLVWVGGLLLNSIPQGAYLTLLVLLSIIIGAKIFEGLNTVGHRYRRVIYNPSSSGTRYLHWRTLCTHAHGNWFSKGRLAFEARHFVLSLLAFEHGVDLPKAEAMVRDGSLDVPDVLRHVIETKHIPDTPPNRFSGLLSWLRRSSRRAANSPDPFVEQLLAELIRFAEHHLEITTHAGNESKV